MKHKTAFGIPIPRSRLWSFVSGICMTTLGSCLLGFGFSHTSLLSFGCFVIGYGVFGNGWDMLMLQNEYRPGDDA